MPRSGYDRTNHTNLQDAKRNQQASQASTDTLEVGVQARSIPASLTPPASQSDPYSPSPLSPSSIVQKPRSVRLSSSDLSSAAAPSSIYSATTSTVPFGGRPTPIPSPASSVTRSPNPTTSSLSPSPRTSKIGVDRAPLPTVRLSPGYVENTGGYRVYNSRTGRGWRYSSPGVGSVSPAPTRDQNQQSPTILGHERSRRQRQAAVNTGPGAISNRKRPAQSVARRETRLLSRTRPSGCSPGIAGQAVTIQRNLPQSPTPNGPNPEGRLNNTEQVSPNHSRIRVVSDSLSAPNVANITEEREKQGDGQGIRGLTSEPPLSCSSNTRDGDELH